LCWKAFAAKTALLSFVARKGSVDLRPTGVDKLGGPKAVTIGHEDHYRVPMPPAVFPNNVQKPFDLCFRQVLTGSQVGVRRPPGRDCSFYDGWRDQLQVCFRRVFGFPSPIDWPNNSFYEQCATPNSGECLSHFDSIAAQRASHQVSLLTQFVASLVDEYMQRRLTPNEQRDN
jgi:hypothetical protein